MERPYRICSEEESFALALQVVAWALSDQTRAERLLSLTGLDPQTLRENLMQPGTLGALLDFVLDHEPDLMACAVAIGVAPGDIAAARRGLGRRSARTGRDGRMTRPLIISDCDEVLLHMVVPFRSWLDDVHASISTSPPVSRKRCATRTAATGLNAPMIEALLRDFFQTQMDRQGRLTARWRP